MIFYNKVNSISPIRFLILIGLLSLVIGCKNEEKKAAEEADSLTDEKTLYELSSKDAIKAKHLLSVKEVKEMLDKKMSVVIFELSKGDRFNKEGHLPGALHLWRPDYGSKKGYDFGGMRASQKEMEKLLSEKGVSPETPIIIYDTKGSCDAVRLMWLLDMYGHTKIEVMNGGKVAWEAAGFPLEQTASPDPIATAYKFPQAPDHSRFATMEEVLAAIDDPEVILVDTREPEEFFGQPYISKGKLYPWKKGAFTYGCIPSAIYLNWSEAVDLKGDHRFKSIKDLKYNFEKAGITPDKKIITYCQSGVRSSNTTYVLTEILGYPQVKNYDGSWIEWSYHYNKDKSVKIERHTSEEEYQKQYAALEIQLKNEIEK